MYPNKRRRISPPQDRPTTGPCSLPDDNLSLPLLNPFLETTFLLAPVQVQATSLEPTKRSPPSQADSSTVESTPKASSLRDALSHSTTLPSTLQLPTPEPQPVPPEPSKRKSELSENSSRAESGVKAFNLLNTKSDFSLPPTPRLAPLDLEDVFLPTFAQLPPPVYPAGQVYWITL